MRTAVGFYPNGEVSPAPSSSSSSSSSSNSTHTSAWHSPVPYLFGGLAAMLGLIAFALLILACSYWKLSGHLEGGGGAGDGGDSGPGSGDGKPSGGPSARSTSVLEERIVVIMAGDDKPTFLATPISARPAPFPDGQLGGREAKAAVDGEAKTPSAPEPAVPARGGDATQQRRGSGDVREALSVATVNNN